MLRIVQSNSSGRARSYYTTADYYTEGQELTGVWRGEAARLLGLSGNVTREAWELLCENLDPRSGERLTAKTMHNRRVGYDFNFHCPKSVSVLYGFTGDERLLDAFRSAVNDTMNDVERDAATRVRANGRDDDRNTGNLVWGEFVHTTSRPVGGIPDPHLHAHCFVFNATFDSKEQQWKAAQFGAIKRDAPYYEALFHARLASNLRDLGLEITRSAKSWELAGIDAATIATFSRRTKLIEKLAKAEGITDPDAKSALGARTREKKAKELSLPELQQHWTAQVDIASLANIAAAAHAIGSTLPPFERHAPEQSVDHAVDHSFERSSVVSTRQLLTYALRRGTGTATADAIVDAFRRRPEFIHARRDGRDVVTTQKVLDEEQRIVRFARAGRGAATPLGKGVPASFDAPGASMLNADQRAAVRHVLESPDRVILIRGAAGVGKTTMMQIAARAIREHGTNVFAFAPSSDASRNTLREAGFEDAETVAMLLSSPQIHERIDHAVLWIDESGQLGTETLDKVFALAEKHGCRVTLSGDTRQHASVSRGSPMKLLETEAGLKPAEIREVLRQTGSYKRAVELLGEGNTMGGFDQLDRLGWIREIDDDQRYLLLARDYVDATLSGTPTLVVCPTHVEGDRVTQSIRQQLVEHEKLGLDEREFPVLRNANLTVAERSDPVSYLPGDVVVFHQNAKGPDGGFRKGQRLIAGRDEIPLHLAPRFTVYHRDALQLRVGDRIRITSNGKTADQAAAVYNGTLATVAGFTRDGDIQLDSGKTIGHEFGHLAYGYTVTSHASQGKSIANVLVAQGSESFGASSREQFYVSLSRGKRKATVYTDNKARLLEAVLHSDERTSATELVEMKREREREREREAERDRVEQMRRTLRNQSKATVEPPRERVSDERSRDRA
jgi:conjugative relaxase-like TrwC/TraI family protein